MLMDGAVLCYGGCMLKVSKKGIRSSVVITLLLSVFDYSSGDEVGFFCFY